MTERETVASAQGQPVARWPARLFLLIVILPLALLVIGGSALSITGSETVVTAKGIVVSAGAASNGTTAILAGIDAREVDKVQFPKRVIVRHETADGLVRYIAQLGSIADDAVRGGDLSSGAAGWPPVIYLAALVVATDSSVQPRPEPPIPMDARVTVEFHLGWRSNLAALTGSLVNDFEFCCMGCR